MKASEIVLSDEAEAQCQYYTEEWAETVSSYAPMLDGLRALIRSEVDRATREKDARIAELLRSHDEWFEGHAKQVVALRGERDALKAEVARLQSWLTCDEHAVPFGEPSCVFCNMVKMRAEVARLEDDRDMWKLLEDIRAHERDSALADLAAARKQIEEAEVQQEVSRTLQSCSDVTEGLRAEIADARRALGTYSANSIRLSVAENIHNLNANLLDVAIERNLALADLAAARKQIEEARGLAAEVIARIAESRKGSIGSIDSTYLPQIDVREVERWRGCLASTAPEGEDRG
jgi:hypothetical protein